MLSSHFLSLHNDFQGFWYSGFLQHLLDISQQNTAGQFPVHWGELAKKSDWLKSLMQSAAANTSIKDCATFQNVLESDETLNHLLNVCSKTYMEVNDGFPCRGRGFWIKLLFFFVQIYESV